MLIKPHVAGPPSGGCVPSPHHPCAPATVTVPGGGGGFSLDPVTLLSNAVRDGVNTTLSFFSNNLPGMLHINIGRSFDSIYVPMLVLSGIIALGALSVSAGWGAVKGDPRHVGLTLTRVFFGIVGAFALALAVPLARSAVPGMSQAIIWGLTGSRHGLSGLTDKLSVVTTAGIASGVVSAIMVIVLGTIVILGIIMCFCALVVANALSYILVLFAPLAFVLSTRASRRLLEVLLAAIMTPFLIVSVMALGIAVANDGPSSLQGAVGGSIEGAVIFILAAVSPMALLRLIPIVGAHLGASHDAASSLINKGKSALSPSQQALRNKMSSRSTPSSSSSKSKPTPSPKTPTATSTGGSSTAAATSSGSSAAGASSAALAAAPVTAGASLAIAAGLTAMKAIKSGAQAPGKAAISASGTYGGGSLGSGPGSDPAVGGGPSRPALPPAGGSSGGSSSPGTPRPSSGSGSSTSSPTGTPRPSSGAAGAHRPPSGSVGSGGPPRSFSSSFPAAGGRSSPSGSGGSGGSSSGTPHSSSGNSTRPPSQPSQPGSKPQSLPSKPPSSTSRPSASPSSPPKPATTPTTPSAAPSKPSVPPSKPPSATSTTPRPPPAPASQPIGRAPASYPAGPAPAARPAGRAPASLPKTRAPASYHPDHAPASRPIFGPPVPPPRPPGGDEE